MKRFMVIFIFLFFIATASALTISAPEIVDQGSTTIFTLQGNVLDPITKSDIGFYEGRVQIPFNYDVEKIKDTYYIYALMPYEKKSYSLRVTDVYFKENNKFLTEDLEFNFSITDNVAEFNINPGFAITNKNSLEFDLYNNLNSNLEVTYKMGEIEDSIILALQETTHLEINIGDMGGTSLNTLSINSENLQYDLPIYVLGKNFIEMFNETDQESPGELPIDLPEGSDLQFSSDKIDETLNVKEAYEYSFLLTNSGDQRSGSINLKVSKEIEDIVELEVLSIVNLDPGEESDIRLSILSENTGIFMGGILAESQNSFDELEVILMIGEDIEPITSIKSELSCIDLDGEICLSSQICSGTNVPSKDGVLCCTAGECITKKKSSSKLGGLDSVSIILIGVSVLIILIAVVWRLKKPKLSRRKYALSEPKI